MAIFTSAFRRLEELDRLYVELQMITGYSVEQLRDMFKAGYILTAPDNRHEDMNSLKNFSK